MLESVRDNRAIDIDHIVWDWNGTLLDDNPVMLASVNDVCAAYGAPAITLTDWHAAFCRPLWRCYSKVLRQEITEDAWPVVEATYHDAYRTRLRECGLAADARDCLDRAWRGGVSQSVLSMGFHDDVVEHVSNSGIAEYFVAVDGVTDRVSGGNKAAYLYAHLKRIGARPERTLMIGDVVDDAHAAEEVGTQVVLVSTGMTDAATLQTAGAVTSSLTSALDLALRASA